jgi:hypothetical protein
MASKRPLSVRVGPARVRNRGRAAFDGDDLWFANVRDPQEISLGLRNLTDVRVTRPFAALE